MKSLLIYFCFLFNNLHQKVNNSLKARKLERKRTEKEGFEYAKSLASLKKWNDKGQNDFFLKKIHFSYFNPFN